MCACPLFRHQLKSKRLKAGIFFQHGHCYGCAAAVLKGKLNARGRVPQDVSTVLREVARKDEERKRDSVGFLTADRSII